MVSSRQLVLSAAEAQFQVHATARWRGVIVKSYGSHRLAGVMHFPHPNADGPGVESITRHARRSCHCSFYPSLLGPVLPRRPYIALLAGEFLGSSTCQLPWAWAPIRSPWAWGAMLASWRIKRRYPALTLRIGDVSTDARQLQPLARRVRISFPSWVNRFWVSRSAREASRRNPAPRRSQPSTFDRCLSIFSSLSLPGLHPVGRVPSRDPSSEG